jgi:hypothetical protein
MGYTLTIQKGVIQFTEEYAEQNETESLPAQKIKIKEGGWIRLTEGDSDTYYPPHVINKINVIKH